MFYKKLYFFLLFGISILMFESCKIFRPQNNTPEQIVIFPAPPDTARIQYLTSISSSLDISKKQSAFSKFVLGEEKPKAIVKPFGVDMRFGRLYVCDVGLKSIEIIDLEKNTFEYFTPTGKGKLIIPVNCYVDVRGYLYIADSGRNQIVVFDNTGKYVNSFGEIIKYKPLDVFVSDDKIWVANMENHKIHVYKNDTTYQFLYSFPELTKGEDGFLFQPKDIYVTNDKVYVSDLGGFKINIFTKEGKFLSSIGGLGKNPGQFTRPKGIAVDKEENLYVIDAAFGNAQIFNKNNKLLMFFGGPYNGKGYMYLPANITIDYENIKYFEKYVDPEYKLKYLIIVTNQYGPDKLNIYGRVEIKNK